MQSLIGLRLAAAALACAACLSGCSKLASGSDIVQAEYPAPDAGAPPAPPDPRWSCLGTPQPAAAVPVRSQVALSFAIVDPTSPMPPANLSARACNLLDVNCQTPASGAAAVGSDGLIHLSVPQGFTGFVEVTSPAIVPTLFFLDQPLQSDRQDGFSVISPPALAGLAQSADVTLLAGMGHLLFRTYDCQGTAAADVQISNNKGGTPFVFVNGLPSPGVDVTSSDGLGGFVNVPPGLVTMTGVELSDNQVSGTVSVVVRDGWFTYGDLTPVTR